MLITCRREYRGVRTVEWADVEEARLLEEAGPWDREQFVYQGVGCGLWKKALQSDCGD